MHKMPSLRLIEFLCKQKCHSLKMTVLSFFIFFKKTAEIQRLRATASIPARVFSSTHVFRLPFLSVLVLKIISTVAFWQNRAALLGGSVIVLGAATVSTLGVRAALRSAVRFRAGGKATEQAADCGALKRRNSTGKFHEKKERVGPAGHCVLADTYRCSLS